MATEQIVHENVKKNHRPFVNTTLLFGNSQFPGQLCCSCDNVFSFQFTVVDVHLTSSSIHFCIPLKSQYVDPINTINNDNDTVDGNGEIERDIVY